MVSDCIEIRINAVSVITETEGGITLKERYMDKAHTLLAFPFLGRFPLHLEGIALKSVFCKFMTFSLLHLKLRSSGNENRVNP